MKVQEALEYVDPTDANCAAEIAEAALTLIDFLLAGVLRGDGVIDTEIRKEIQQQIEDVGLALRLDQHDKGNGWEGIAQVLGELE